MYGWFGGGHMGWMWIGWFGAVALVAALVVGLARGTRDDRVADGPRLHGNTETPEQILKRRYARGEIDREEYERKLEDVRR